MLQQIGIVPDQVIPADVDETPLPRELPGPHAARLALAKAQKIALQNPGCYILAADSLVACGRRILPKALVRAEAEFCFKLLSGRRHRVYGGVCLMTPERKTLSRVVCTMVQFKRLTDFETSWYLDSGEWEGKAGGYGIQGKAACFAQSISGSYSNIVGLSLYDSLQMLNGLGFSRK